MCETLSGSIIFGDDYLRRGIIFFTGISSEVYTSLGGEERVGERERVGGGALYVCKVPNAVRRDRVPEVSLRFINPFHERSCVLPDCNRVARR